MCGVGFRGGDGLQQSADCTRLPIPLQSAQIAKASLQVTFMRHHHGMLVLPGRHGAHMGNCTREVTDPCCIPQNNEPMDSRTCRCSASQPNHAAPGCNLQHTAEPPRLRQASSRRQLPQPCLTSSTCAQSFSTVSLHPEPLRLRGCTATHKHT